MNKNKNLIRVTLALIIGAAVFCYLTRNYSFNNLGMIARKLDFFKIFMGFLFLAITYLFGGYRWHYLFNEYPYFLSVNAVIVSVAANTIIPVRAGELVRALFLKNNTGISGTETIARVIVERVLDAISVLSYLLLTFLLMGKIIGNKVNHVLIYGGIIIISFILLVLIYIEFSHKIDPFFKRVSKRKFIPLKLIETGKVFLNTFKQMKIKRTILPLIMSFLTSFSRIISLWFFLNACGVLIGLDKTVLIYPLVTLSISVPVTVAHIGVFHGALLGSLSIVGFAGEEIIGSVIFVHLLSIVMPAIYGWVIIIVKMMPLKISSLFNFKDVNTD